ncbi:endonuclease/exonuclease/phosphatase family protein [Archangium lansingense]|uniref:Endonuclease/exonuclease/phosphatase family protein n=1 Tax=Archangium lansingense TaxID=2995310 RepID=A0ABT4A3X9_9BACT|nr:endonuclease/exonuclease/phosphatase family protein [Archangium lansinium]MCY1076352.1 endonuclease/exonuclease/phosphatase family protein [Archangium lansinium]
MRIDRLLAGLFLATSVACASSSSSLRADSAPVTLSDLGALTDPVSARTGGDLRVMTFNIQSAIRGLDKVAEVIRSASPDIVALQEVDVGSWRARGMHQPAELARRTGLKYYAHFRTTRLFGGDYGVALLSRYPLESVEQHPLPVLPGTEPRTVARVLVKVNGQDVSVYVTHLTQRPFTGDIRVRQSAAIMRLMAKDPRPKLLMGDMNDTPDSGSLRLFKHALADVFDLRGKGPADTYPLPLFPGLRIDYVLASDRFMPRSSEVLRVKASDHYPLVADLTLFEPAKAPTPEGMERLPETVPAGGP